MIMLAHNVHPHTADRGGCIKTHHVDKEQKHSHPKRAAQRTHAHRNVLWVQSMVAQRQIQHADAGAKCVVCLRRRMAPGHTGEQREHRVSALALCYKDCLRRDVRHACGRGPG